MASMTTTSKGFDVACPACGQDDGAVMVDLNDLGECACDSCGERFTAREAVEKAAEQLRRWEAVARWIEMAPRAMA